MPTITLTPVVIHYAVAPEQVHVRVRTYADARAIEEKTYDVSDAAIAAEAAKHGRTVWDNVDVAAAMITAGLEGCIWGGEAYGTELRADFLAMPDGPSVSLEQQLIAELREQLEATQKELAAAKTVGAEPKE